MKHTRWFTKLPGWLIRYSFIVVPALHGLAHADDAVSTDIAHGAEIRNIEILRQNVFNLENPDENNALYRLANRLHIITRESVVSKQLLVAEGDAFDRRLAEESERILRGNKYVYDATISASPNTDGSVDLTVSTRDVWTLTPEITFSRSGGEERWTLGAEESNLLGSGQRIMLARTDDVDRTSDVFEYTNRQIGASWVSVGLRIADTSDGRSNLVSVARPFHALDARFAAGFSVFDDERRSALYVLGNEAAEFQHERDLYSAFGGWSSGLRNGWVTRWTAGFSHDDNVFSAVAVPTLPAAVPADRRLVYPFFGVEILEDRFEKASNHDQIERSEDFYLGSRFAATVGWSDTGFDADRDALIYFLSASRGFGSLAGKSLFLSADIRGRQEHGNSVNATSRVDLRYYWRQSEKRLFFAELEATYGHDLDLDNPVEIGGDTGLRGYPLRYQSGDSRMLVRLEQRYFTDWYPFRFFRVGGAVFLDAGRTWGDNPLGGNSIGWLKDVGFGLRLAPTRFGTRKVFHLDVAFPLDGDPSIDEVQVLFEGKRSF